MQPLKIVNIKIFGPPLLGLLIGTPIGLGIAYFLSDISQSYWIVCFSSLIVFLITSFISLVFMNKTLSQIAYLIRNVLAGKKDINFSPNNISSAFRDEMNMIFLLIDKMNDQVKMSYNRINNEVKTLEAIDNETAQFYSGNTRFEQLQSYIEQSLEQLSKIIKINKELVNSAVKITESTEEMAKDTTSTTLTATEGIKSVGHEIRAISDLKSTMGSSSRIIQDLNEMSHHVSQFITTVSTISRRTELLALNAGIEAARAGEAGKGFSVVANEIRTLSESSKKASDEIGNLIREIEIRTQNAIKAMQNTNKLEENIKIVYAAGDTFMHIVREIKGIDKIVHQISETTSESSQESQLMNKLLEKLETLLHEEVAILSDVKQEIIQQTNAMEKIRAYNLSILEQIRQQS